MRAIWSGAISFGLVNIPVRLYSATEERALSFHLFHKKDHGGIRYARVCKTDGKEVPYQDIEKGYEFRKGDYVMVSDEDFEKASPRKTKTIDIAQFVLEKDIDPIYFDKPYYLEPDKGADKAYVLFREALRASKKVAIAKFVLRNKEHLAALKPSGDAIVLEQMRFHDELRTPEKLELPKAKEKEAPKKELAIAIKLIDQLTGHFEPTAYKDSYTHDLLALIEQKAKGKTISIKEEAPTLTEVPDLMEVLMQSLQKTQKARDGQKRKTTR